MTTELLKRMMRRYTPPMNRLVMEGLATETLNHIESYFDKEIRSICTGFPPCLRYIRLERCTPQEEYLENTKPRTGRRIFDLAKSTIYLIKIFFEFTDETGIIHELIRYQYLPFCERGGIFMLSGAQHHFVPVLSDKVFTPTNGSLFVRLMQDKNIMSRRPYPLIINGQREIQYIVVAKIYRNKTKGATRNATGKIDTVLMHYLLARFGFTETFRRWCGLVPEFGGDEMTAKTHPPEAWVLCETAQPMPRGVQHIKLAVRKEQWTPEFQSFIFAFFYIIDNFPGRFYPTVKSLDERAHWMILIGHIVKGNIWGDNKLYEDIQEHLEFLDVCLDVITQEKLNQRGIHLNDYYDLLAYIQINFKNLVTGDDARGLSVYGKNLEILYYVLYEFVYGYVMVKFKLSKIAKSRQITLTDVTSNMNQYIKPSKPVFRLGSGKIVTELVSYSGDHLYPKITAIVAEQESQAGAQRNNSDQVVVGPKQHLDLSMIEFGSILNLPKQNPTPVARINPWVQLDPTTGTVLQNPKLRKLLEENNPYFNLL